MQKRLEQFAKKAREYDARAKKAHDLQLKKDYEGFARTVGTVLPESGITYYDVPADFGVMQYRYTVVNNNPVLVQPRTRRVVQVIQ